jgi:hypothetical protein
LITAKIQFNPKDLEKSLKGISKSVERSQRRAVDRSLKRTRRYFVDEAYSLINLQKGVIKEKYTEIRKSFSGLDGFLKINAKPVSLVNFTRLKSPKRIKTKKGLSVRIYRGQPAKTYPKSFAAFGKNGNLQVFKRKVGGRYPLEKLFGPGPREVYEFPGFGEDLQEFFNSEYQKEFTSNLKRLEKLRR